LTTNTKIEFDRQFATLPPPPPPPSLEPLGVVMGNIPKAENFEQAEAWFRKRCSETNTPLPREVYIKGDFKGLIFAKCSSVAHRDQVIAIVRNCPGGVFPKPWAKVDQPFDIRTAESALSSIKRMLIDWGYNKSAVRVDTDTNTLKIMNKEVAKAEVNDFVLKLTWCDGEWAEWEELQNSEDYVKIQAVAKERLEKAKSSGSGDGKGKGKSFPQ